MKITKTIEKDENEYFSSDGYTGIWEVYWPNGQLKSRNSYFDGKEDGAQLCFWNNGNLAQKGQCKNGICIGRWVDYSYEGIKFKETDFLSDGICQNRYYDSTGNVDSIDEWKNSRPRKIKNLFLNLRLKMRRAIKLLFR